MLSSDEEDSNQVVRCTRVAEQKMTERDIEQTICKLEETKCDILGKLI